MALKVGIGQFGKVPKPATLCANRQLYLQHIAFAGHHFVEHRIDEEAQ